MTGTAVGLRGTILRTTDAGNHWIEQVSGTTSDLQAVDFVNRNVGVACGYDGKILRTTDGGSTWVTQFSASFTGHFGVSFANEKVGTVVGTGPTATGLIRRTTDGGTTWVQQTSGVNKFLNAVSFADTNIGTAVGNTGTIIRTTNGGTTWFTQTSGTTRDLNGVCFTDVNTGTAVGSNGTILRTTNGGTNWVTQSSGATDGLIDVSFSDARHGVAVGSFGRLIRTTNGGATWTAEPSGVGGDLFAVSCTDSANATVAGVFGAILRTGDGIVPGPPPPPHLLSVRDVPNDQGGKVTLRWNASPLDTNVATLPFYSIWRAVPRGQNGLSEKTGSSSVEVATSNEIPVRRFITLNGVAYEWEWIANQPAHRYPNYTYTAATLYDSSSRTNGKHYFLISAHTSNPNVFYDSNPDSGHSVDNLPPLAPANVAGSRVGNTAVLHWNSNTESDLSGYEIYRSTQPYFNPDTMTALAIITDTAYVDATLPLNRNSYYAIRARDVHDNRSSKSNEVAIILVGVSENANSLPTEFALYQNYPNPFNPTTEIRYSIPEVRDQSSEVSRVILKVFDIIGREVATLVDEEMKPGSYKVRFEASSLASGIYIYTMKAGHFVASKKLLLMK